MPLFGDLLRSLRDHCEGRSDDDPYRHPCELRHKPRACSRTNATPPVTSAAPFSGWWRVNGQRVTELGWPQWIPWWEAVDFGFPDWTWPHLRRRLFGTPLDASSPPVLPRSDCGTVPYRDVAHRAAGYWR